MRAARAPLCVARLRVQPLPSERHQPVKPVEPSSPQSLVLSVRGPPHIQRARTPHDRERPPHSVCAIVALFAAPPPPRASIGLGSALVAASAAAAAARPRRLAPPAGGTPLSRTGGLQRPHAGAARPSGRPATRDALVNGRLGRRDSGSALICSPTHPPPFAHPRAPQPGPAATPAPTPPSVRSCALFLPDGCSTAAHLARAARRQRDRAATTTPRARRDQLPVCLARSVRTAAGCCAPPRGCSSWRPS